MLLRDGLYEARELGPPPQHHDGRRRAQHVLERVRAVPLPAQLYQCAAVVAVVAAAAAGAVAPVGGVDVEQRLVAADEDRDRAGLKAIISLASEWLHIPFIWRRDF